MAYAVVSVIGHDRPGFVRELSSMALACELNIDDTRAAGLGAEFAVLMGVSGTETAISRLQAELQTRSDEAGFTYLVHLASDRTHKPEGMRQTVSVLAMDHPGIVHKVSGFFADRGLNIEELTTDTHPAPHTGTPMFDLRMTLLVPPDQDTEQLQQAFMTYCNDNDLDGSMEMLF